MKQVSPTNSVEWIYAASAKQDPPSCCRTGRKW